MGSRKYCWQIILLVVFIIVFSLSNCTDSNVTAPDFQSLSHPIYFEDIQVGDLNCDGIPYTIADIVMFINFFVDRDSALMYADTQFANVISDVNQDGHGLSVADMSLMIRIVVGDYFPLVPRKTDPFSGRIIRDILFYNPRRQGTFNLDPIFINRGVNIIHGNVEFGIECSAVYLIYEGIANVQLLDYSMEMKSEYRNDSTYVIVYSLDGHTFSGEIVRSDGELLYLEAADKDCQPIISRKSNIPGSRQYDYLPYISENTLERLYRENTEVDSLLSKLKQFFDSTSHP